LKQYGIDKVSAKTKIAKKNLVKLRDRDFEGFSKPQAFGFLSILQREYGDECTELKTALEVWFTEQKGGEKKEEIFVADPSARTILFKGHFLDLTAAEYDILSMLLQHKNGSVSREQLLYESEHIDDDSSIKNIDVIISRIRQKIAKIDPDHAYIKPIRGVGYLLTDRV